MSTASIPYIATRCPLSPDGMFAYARTICGVSIGTECLPPDVERDFVDFIRKVTHWLNYLAGKPAFAQEAAEEYHQHDRGAVDVKAPRDRGAPAVTLDAAIYSTRELGFTAAMARKCNRDRIREMLPAQRKELTERLQRLINNGAIKP